MSLYSRRGTDLTQRFKDVNAALASLPDDTVIDGELVALDDPGSPTSICCKISVPPNRTSCSMPSTCW